ncbi:MAG: hypothetical protein FWB71_04110, partial [Defluviitaleaceae bacterium]|nr:hypothetical protein [Defluviitaleaceae bacterium]
MKKFFLAICIYIVITAFVAVCLNAANPGDIAGRIYSSDILAKIGGHPVPSYNIGGRTVIVLEDLADYLIFDYDFIRWNEDLRILAVSLENPHGAHQRFVARHAVGGVPIGNIYHTDIRVYINGRPIPAYSLNGRMAVAIEDIGGVASGEVWSPFYAVYNWREDTRTIYLDFIPGDNLWDIADIVGERPLYLAIFGNQIHFGFDHFRPGFGVSSQFAPARGITPLY